MSTHHPVVEKISFDIRPRGCVILSVIYGRKYQVPGIYYEASGITGMLPEGLNITTLGAKHGWAVVSVPRTLRLAHHYLAAMAHINKIAGRTGMIQSDLRYRLRLYI